MTSFVPLNGGGLPSVLVSERIYSAGRLYRRHRWTKGQWWLRVATITRAIRQHTH